MSRSYRDVESARIVTSPFMTEAAEAALSLLARRGAPTGGDEVETWRLACVGGSGARFLITCTGPSLPVTIPDEVIRPGDIANNRPFVGTWRLIVKAPVIVLDLYWQADTPLRIMTFANGDWQRELVDLALAVTPA